MSALGTLAAGVKGGIWKIVAVILLAALLVVGAWAGGGWFLAARDRDAAQAELVAERAKSAACAAAVERQNAAVTALADATREAGVRGQAAQQQAAATGRRLDLVLRQTQGAKATTCDEAMPVVDLILQEVK